MTPSVPGAEPDDGEIEIQDCADDAVHVSEPDPEFVTSIFCTGGFDPPSDPLKVSAGAESVSVGGTETVKVTGMATGDPAAPADVTVTVPE